MRLPSHGQLALPLLDTLLESGPVRASQACQILAERLEIHPEIRGALGTCSTGQKFNLFDRRSRWVKQTLAGKGLIHTPERGLWALTEKGSEIAAAKADGPLGPIQRGTVVSLFTTHMGQFFWGYAEDVVSRIDDGSVNLFFTSPPYPLIRAKGYGNLNGESYLNWLEDILGIHLSKLTTDGAFLVNLGEAYEESGSSALSTYREELTIRARKNLGLHLYGKMYWQNPSKPPAGYWVTHAKSRPKNTIEEILWMAPSQPKFRGDNALTPYGSKMLKTLANGGERRSERPGGHGSARNGFSKDRGGAIPGQLITAAHANPNGPYFKFCREQDIPIHPARFPESLAEKMILLHSDRNDIIGDPFGGSGTTAAVAQKLGRRWVTGEPNLAYAIGAAGRFDS